MDCSNNEATIDIGSRNSEGAAARLSNFQARHFTFDGVPCSSIEGVLQSFKFEDRDIQREICSLVGIKAKKAGRQTDWRPSQTLYWDGVAYPRDSPAYQQLLDRLYEAVFEQDSQFVSDLYETGARRLTHSIGLNDPAETILTEVEFCGRLERLRRKLRQMFKGKEDV